MSANHEAQTRLYIVQRIKNGKIAFPRHAKCVRCSLGQQVRDQDVTAGAQGMFGQGGVVRR